MTYEGKEYDVPDELANYFLRIESDLIYMQLVNELLKQEHLN